MKYTKDTTDKFIEALEAGKGRVEACKYACINYQTFLNWKNDQNKIEFLERIKEAENKGKLTLKEMAINGIVSKFNSQWTAGAWWLERNYPDEFKNKTFTEETGLPTQINVTIKKNEGS